MPVFQYTALDANGKEVKAEIEALSSKEAISKIRNKGLFPTKVRAQNAPRKVKAEAAAAPPKRHGVNARSRQRNDAICPSNGTLQDPVWRFFARFGFWKSRKKPGVLSGYWVMWPRILKAGRRFRRR